MLLKHHKLDEIINERRRKQQTVESVQDASVARNHSRGILHLHIPLDERLEEVAELTDDARQKPKQTCVPPFKIRREGRTGQERRGDGKRQPAKGTLSWRPNSEPTMYAPLSPAQVTMKARNTKELPNP
jgi:hypothetical protein